MGPNHPARSPWILLEGIGVGAACGLLLTLANLFDILIDDRFGGVAAPTIHRFLATDYRAEVVHSALELLALSLCIGMLVGAVAAQAVAVRQRWSGGTDSVWWARLLKLGLTVGSILGLVYLHDVAARPALHQPELLERGGIAAAVQVFVADVLGTAGVAIVGGLLALGYFLWPLHKRRFEVRRWRPWVVTAVLITLSMLGVRFATGHNRAGRQGTPAGPPNVLIIAADSLRPDRLDARRAPNIARLLEQSTSFERAYTPLARTFPAWVSIATGQYPHRHGIRHMFPRWETRKRNLETLGERYADAGYATAVVGDFAADIFRRIDLGYGRVCTPTFTMRELVREHLLKNDPWLIAWIRGRAMRWLVPVIVEMHEATDPMAVTRDAVREIERASEKPFFVTVFYSTPHFPYAAPGPHYRRFTAKGYSGPYRYAKADTLNASEEMGPEDITQVRALYDGAVYATDAAVGVLLDELVRRGLDSRTIVVVTADHGEGLYEYGRSQGHGDHLQGDEPLRVPLSIFDPRKPGKHLYQQPVSLVDVAPTLLDLSGLSPLNAADGRSLAVALDGVEPAPRSVYSETGLWFTEVIAEVPLERRIPYPDLTQLTEVDRSHGDQIVVRQRFEPTAIAAKHRMIQRGSLRLIYMPTRTGPRFELCDLAADPGCASDVSKAHVSEFVALKTEFWNFVSNDPAVVRDGEVLLPLAASRRTPTSGGDGK